MDLGELFLRNIGRVRLLSTIYTKYEIGPSAQQVNNENILRLPEPITAPSLSLLECLSNRNSCTSFSDTLDLNDGDISYILKYSFGLRSDTGKRAYPSGGAFYPVDTYIIKKIDGEFMLYLYDPEAHALMFRRSGFDGIINSLNSGNSLTVLFAINTVYSKAKYGELSWLLALLECGHLAQNIYLVCASKGIACSGIGGIKWDITREILGKHTYPVYAMLLGYPSEVNNSLSMLTKDAPQGVCNG